MGFAYVNGTKLLEEAVVGATVTFGLGDQGAQPVDHGLGAAVLGAAGRRYGGIIG